MRFAIGDATVDIIVDDDDFGLSLSEFLPYRRPTGTECHLARSPP